MSGIAQGYIVPGLPHLVFAQEGYEALRAAYRQAGEEVQALNPDVLVIYSAQWISVLGHSFQTDPRPQGLHVDENWHAMGEFPFSFPVDVPLAEKAAELAEARGLATKRVNYPGFPIDTGTLVCQHFLNPESRIPVVIVSSNIYCGREDSMALGEAVAEAVEQSGKRAVLVACTSLSNRFWTHSIEPGADAISRPEDEAWNRRMLDLLQAGYTQEALDLTPQFAQEASAEMMFKGFYWLMGALKSPAVAAQVKAYEPIWGTGAAVVSYPVAVA